MTRLARGSIALGVVVVLALAATAVVLLGVPEQLDGLSSDGALVASVSTTAPDGALRLDEPDTQERAPALARLLDAAARDGSASTQATGDINAIVAYLDERARASGHSEFAATDRTVAWRGAIFLVTRMGS